jgi:hypothetical protein
MKPPVCDAACECFATRNMLRTAVWLGSISSLARAADGGLPPLQPPHGELPPTFWEQHGWAVILAALAALALLVSLVLWLRRPKPVVVVPPEVLARRDLEALRGKEENGDLLVKVSGILRHYVTFACGLPPGEVTTTELCQAVGTHPRFKPELASAIADFLRQCDERKFSPTPPAANLGAVATALGLVEKIEQRRREMSNALPPPLPPAVPQSALSSTPQ